MRFLAEALNDAIIRVPTVCFTGPEDGGFSLRELVPGGERVVLFNTSPGACSHS